MVNFEVLVAHNGCRGSFTNHPLYSSYLNYVCLHCVIIHSPIAAVPFSFPLIPNYMNCYQCNILIGCKEMLCNATLHCINQQSNQTRYRANATLNLDGSHSWCNSAVRKKRSMAFWTCLQTQNLSMEYHAFFLSFSNNCIGYKHGTDHKK